MKDDKVKEAILRGIASKGQTTVEEEIAEEIFSDNAQNQHFIDNIFEDKDAIEQVASEFVESQEDTEKEGKDNETVDNKDGENNEEIKEQRFGKFKNPDELYKAYCELEKEFTRRSQKLKQLQNDAEIGFASEEQWKEAVEKFFEKIPSAKNFAKDIACKIMEEPELKRDKNCLNIALTRVLADKFQSPEELMQDGQFLEKYVFGSKDVQDRIIETYLKGVRNGQPPVTLVESGTQCVAPSLKPRNIQEAGMLFLKNNR